MHHPLSDLLARRGSLVIDGAMSTALESKGCDLNDSLWSSKVLIESPETIKAVHRDYFDAGANIAITASYQASEAGFAKRGYDARESRALIMRSVELAQEARSEWAAAEPGRTTADCLIAGAVGPYGAYLANGAEYTGDYALTKDEFKRFHELRVNALIDAGADILAFETMPRFDEVEALLELIAGRDVTCWVTVTFAKTGGETMADGTELEKLAKLLDANPQVEAFGLNCVKRPLVEAALKRFRSVSTKPLIVYPNSGEVYDPSTKTWHQPPAGSIESQGWGHYVPLWKQLGAVCLGGCCRTLPADILQISKLME